MAESNEERHVAVSYGWQSEQWKKLVGLIEEDRLPHALLLAGVKGIGKFRFAEALAQLLLCDNPVNAVACGQCKACQLNLAGTHPDMKYLQPEEGAQMIKVDQVRAVVQFLDQTSQQGGYKVAILSPAEAMNINAANALLKNLEEPAGKTLLILVTDPVARKSVSRFLMKRVCRPGYRPG